MEGALSEMRLKRLMLGDRNLARTLFTLMADVFEEDGEELSDGYIDRLLGREDFWAIAAFVGEHIIGGVTAHTLPMTRTASSEIFIYDMVQSNLTVRQLRRQRELWRRTHRSRTWGVQCGWIAQRDQPIGRRLRHAAQL